jgi:hypothetical protein
VGTISPFAQACRIAAMLRTLKSHAINLNEEATGK